MDQTLAQQISNFLRDAQYRVGELTVQMDVSMDDGDDMVENKKAYDIRSRLITFMFLLYTNRYDIVKETDGDWPNFLNDWTDREIIQEMEYLRYHCGLSDIPYLEWTGYTSFVLQKTGDGLSIPDGTPGSILVYKTSNTVEAQVRGQYIGNVNNESISDYFNR